MTAEIRELFRENLIAQLAAIGAVGAKLSTLELGARARGFEPTRKDIADELDYLEGKGLAQPADKVISPENVRWKITAAGRDFAAQHGLA